MTRRPLLELAVDTLTRVHLALVEDREAFSDLMAEPFVVELAEELRRDHPDLANRVRAACLSRRALLPEDTVPQPAMPLTR